MRRIGKFTGVIYDEDYDFSLCQECCICVSEKDINDVDYIRDLKIRNQIDCIMCRGCPASKINVSQKIQSI